MFNISSYLEKFKNIGVKELLLKEKVAASVERIVKISISHKDVTIKNGIVTIKMKPMEKSELFIKKNQLLSAVNEGESVKIKDIR